VRALVIGRFQPFHNGHLAVVREVAGDAEEVLIGIAAAADHHTPDNPFTAEERNEMVIRALEEAGIHPFRIIDIPDIHNYPVWARYVVSLCPPFDLVVAHNDTTVDLFREIGYQVRKATPYDRETHSGTRVRELMAENGDWEMLVPDAVAEYLRSIQGPERVRRLAGGDQAQS
jgi:nicotinamide-nucleotide adenylyltransferase